jgi:hypothetical protein
MRPKERMEIAIALYEQCAIPMFIGVLPRTRSNKVRRHTKREVDKI